MNDAAAQFTAHVAQLAARAGIELDDEDLEQLWRESDANGFTPQATETAFESLITGELDWDDDDEGDDFDERLDALGARIAEQEEWSRRDPLRQASPEEFAQHAEQDRARLEKKLGRRLLQTEVESLGPVLREQLDRTGSFDLEKAHAEAGLKLDLSTQEGRTRLMDERLKEKAGGTEPDYDREFDLDKTDDRHAYMQARASGVEFEEMAAPEEAA